MSKTRTKHAYMIAVHKNQEQLEILFKLLDHADNDLYVHVDLKSNAIDTDKLDACIKKGRVFFVDRISVEWARYSIVESTLIMLKAALQNGPYLYYHLLSGQDLPLKPIANINEYYNGNNPAWNYVEYEDSEWAYKNVCSRMNYFRFHSANERRYAKKYRDLIKSIFNFFYVRIYKLPDLKRGGAWFDINDELAQKVVQNEEWIRRWFKYTQFPDETFLQSLIYKEGLQDTCHNYMRYIDWESGPTYPCVFRATDYERLIASGKNFARKFDMDIDGEIINKIFLNGIEGGCP